MLPSSPDPMPRARAERMLIARVITAVGLALLLVVGAWSTSRGSADVHATLCLASGVSESTAAAPTAGDAAAAPTIDVLSSGVGICLLAVLGGVALVLLFRRLAGGTRPLGTRAPRTVSPSRAGPRAFVPALTLTQLSISRT
ncbi:hypothetical protein [Microbacterium maritypicum]|uniref:hypothetical protein n=1 Tax=Microbacterium maritypicum TaxID=33918 RepID=UPI0028E97D88|nr:hypothetical protein [Microbacterium liquefaciens]